MIIPKFRNLNLIVVPLICLATAGNIFSKTIEVKKNGKYPTIQSGVEAASAGDIVMVRDGVYRESVSITISGKPEARLIIKAFPGEKVVMDGSKLLSDWKRCSSAREVDGNPDWENIWYINAPENSNRININLFQGDSILTIAQMPEASDPFYDEETNEWFLTSAKPGEFTHTSITDKTNLSGMKDDFLKHAFVKIVTGNNEVYIQKIDSYSADKHQINFEPLPEGIKMKPGSNRYAISNHPGLINKPGKYYFDEISRKIFIWPYDQKKVNTTVTASIRKEAFSFKGINYLTIENIHFRRYFGKNINGNSSDYILIKNCDFRQGIIEKDGGVGPTIEMYKCNFSVVDGCSLSDNKHTRGIIFNDGSYNTVMNCKIKRIGGTGVDFYRQHHSKMLNNDLRDCNGQHANGLTCYLACRNILIQGNVVINCNVGLTYQEIDSMMVVNNIIHGGGRTQPTACWNASNSGNITFYHNTLIGSGSKHEAIYSQSGNIHNLVVRNNILDGMGKKQNLLESHNLYIGLSMDQHPFHSSDIVMMEGEKEIFKKSSLYDFHLARGSSAIDKGEDLGIVKDLNGNKRPYNKIPDIGAYEWTGEE